VGKFEDELEKEWEKLMETVTFTKHSIKMKNESYKRKCLGPGCDHSFKTTNKNQRLCEYCRKLEIYKSGF
jgi:hypothetical protein